MGTDTEEREVACPCGDGKIIVTVSTPDHGWLSAYNVHRSAQIMCPSCSGEFLIDRMCVVRRDEFNANKIGWECWRNAHKAFDAAEDVLRVKAEFAEYLKKFKSVAAIHRHLVEHQLDNHSIGTFRRNWNGEEDWVGKRIGSYNIAKILSLLGKATDGFSERIREIETLQATIPNARVVMTL
ncbi:MAG: hypothetical protein ACK4FJ_05565 [Ferrovibrio sp.]|uniref:hypothetical protein n=1 Tax=Ferrovibrio sp. TaxID=1917215 RepID=UPI00391CDC0B